MAVNTAVCVNGEHATNGIWMARWAELAMVLMKPKYIGLGLNENRRDMALNQILM